MTGPGLSFATLDSRHGVPHGLRLVGWHDELQPDFASVPKALAFLCFADGGRSFAYPQIGINGKSPDN